MTQELRSLIQLHWSSANARDWDTFATLLDPRLRYDVPQTREYIDGALGYLDMFRTWPGDWRATVKTLVCDASTAICIIDFAVGTDTMTGISVFEFEAARIVKVVDYWPEPYEPPTRTSVHMKRSSGAA